MKRAVLEELKRDELLAALDLFGLEVADRRARDQLIEALAGSRKVRLAEPFGELPRTRLEEICRARGISRFASAESKCRGQFCAPSHMLRALIQVLAPCRDRVYGPCCGSGGTFVQSGKFLGMLPMGDGTLGETPVHQRHAA